MTQDLTQAADALLRQAVSASPGLPGVVALATDRRGTLYAGAAGHRVQGEPAPMTPDTVLAIFSTTKAITATAALLLAEEGGLDLDAPARTYAPAIGELRVLEGFAEDGSPTLRAPRREITTRMLLLHTAGLGYDIFNADYARLARERGQPTVTTGTRAALMTPLLFDPGERWEYGSNIDWAGQVVEGITGQRLGAVMQERIFAPLGMTSTAFTMTPAMRARLARIHQRGQDGSLKPLATFELPQDPEVQMGGHGLYSTADDYGRFIRLWLNDGAGEHGRVLKPETVAMAAQNGLGPMRIRPLPGVIKALSHDAEFFPGMPKSWGLSFMINEEDAPTGRPAGSLAWAGLANLYFWIDRRTGVGGFWGTQIFPFADPASVENYLAFETAVYRSL
ncbi:serine hydrolase domain-containing protein [Methylobacterium isbiliense]|uniref:D-alanyl-D-alanine carboxypeptidase n=1 Tax=Methylobacterium isbiliense TaxID=315478 RepID=A0ABQ4SLJ4_9HYPH|nr:serine hydrolase domain-containing protein [Methylobacterium isbiliense]MDN3627018.1 serine hydrolase domain-containing protein [Methylobacterium isbiliense]GJE03166.1 Putative D-alanyl-D-alanine carboxypeptidase [Methylobacterium isbiliense]